MVHIPRWQLFTVIALIAIGVLFAQPNLFEKNTLKEFPDWIPSDQINLGLDLRGGSYLLVEADLEGVFEEQLDNLESGIRGTLRARRIGYTNLGISDETVQFKLRDPEQRSEVRRLILEDTPGLLVLTDGDGTVTVNFSDEDRRQRDVAVMQQTVEILGIRLNALGLAEPRCSARASAGSSSRCPASTIRMISRRRSASRPE